MKNGKPFKTIKYQTLKKAKTKSILEALKKEEKDFYISNAERKHLIDILIMTSAVLRTGKLYFNKPGIENLKHAEFMECIASRFANMPVIKEQ